MICKRAGTVYRKKLFDATFHPQKNAVQFSVMKKNLIGLGVAVMLVGCGGEPAKMIDPTPPTTEEKAEKLKKATSSCERVGGILKEIVDGNGKIMRMCTMPSAPAAPMEEAESTE